MDVSPTKKSVSPITTPTKSSRKKDVSGPSTSEDKKEPACSDPSVPEVQSARKDESRPKKQDGSPLPLSKRPLANEEAGPSPPKKMLKLRSDGKLLSPKASKATTEPKAKRKTKSNGPRSSNDSRVTVVKYGADANERSKIGKQIQDILEGRATAPKPGVKASRESPRRAKEPPKTTHPFFLGKATKVADSNATLSEQPKKHEAVTALQKPNILSVSSPSKARLLSRNNETAWSDVAGSFRKAPRLPGSIETVWPPKDMVHVRPAESITDITSKSQSGGFVSAYLRKLKDAQTRIPNHEDVLCRSRSLAQEIRLKSGSLDGSGVRKPSRKIMTGPELQKLVSKRTSIVFWPSDADPLEDELDRHTPAQITAPSHGGLRPLYQRISKSLSAFDRFECETVAWVHKYAPKNAEAVLQEGSEAFVLRDWLRSLSISAVEGSNGSKRTRESSAASRNGGISVKRRRKKRAEALDGFVVSSDEEADQLNEIPASGLLEPTAFASTSAKRSVARTTDFANPGARERSNNAVVISGPNGCGKTAAVYAVAHELGFEIFEINAGSRRSGRDILDKVGDMTRNHLVKRSEEPSSREVVDDTEDLLHLTDSLKQDIESGRQGTMQSFFQPKSDGSKKPRGRPKKQEDVQKSKPSPKKPRPEKAVLKQPKAQKQSVILLEEVDVLFEEDKQFWATILEMITRSKRPVIMTCTDESLLPLGDLPLSAILRFQPPPKTLAVDYLLLLAANEGHLLSRDGVSSLLDVKQNDLRASINELNLFCQMAIGDTQGGLGWFLIQSSTERNQVNRQILRVVSEDSYPESIGWLSEHDQDNDTKVTLKHEVALLSEVHHGWGLDIAESDNFVNIAAFPLSSERSEDGRLADLRAMEAVFEGLSAADSCSPLGPRQKKSNFLDPTSPEVSEKTKANYVEGASIIQADPLVDETGISGDLAFTLRALARRSLPRSQPLTSSWITQELPSLLQAHHKPPSVTPQSLQATFTPLKLSFMSTFANAISTLTTDVAPYIRSITAFDLRLEEQRRQLEASRADPRDGHGGKRPRTTRASRAALEGGAKATTRRERWFPNLLDFDLVAKTGGKDWTQAALRHADLGTEGEPELEHPGSTRSMSSTESNEV